MKNFHYGSRHQSTRFALLACVVLFAIFGTSCGDVTKIQYMQGEFDTAKISRINYQEPRIQKGDLLAITVFSGNQMASSYYNQPVNSISASGTPGATSTSVTGYLVDDQGNIRLYQLGTIKVEGLSKRELADLMNKSYLDKNLLTDPHVEIRFLNFKITLIGEFNRPGVYTIPTEKVSVLDAIGLAGDLTGYARKDNVLVIREVNGKREFAKLNLLGTDFFTSPYYYLQQNDMVVVDVTRNKAAVNDQITVRNITVAASILSTIAIFLNVFRN